MGLAHAHRGEEDDARAHLDRAIRLSPRDPSLPFWTLARVISALVAGRDGDYLAEAQALSEGAPDFVGGWRHVAAACAIAGRADDARAAVARALALVPGDTIGNVAARVPIADPAARERHLDGLRRAGYPE